MVDSFDQSQQERAERAFRLQKFRIAFDIYRAVAFFSSVLNDKGEFRGNTQDAVDFAREVILRAAPFLRVDQKEYFINHITVLFARSQQIPGDHRSHFRNLRRIARRVINILGVDEGELKNEWHNYHEIKAQAQAEYLNAINEFLYEKKSLPDSRFDSARKMEIHQMSKEMTDEEMRANPIFQQYREYRDGNKLRINSIACVLGALEDFLEIGDVANRVRVPLLERIHELNQRIVDTVSTAQTNEAIDTETFDVEEYLEMRFTPEYEARRKGADMTVECIADTEKLAHDILDAVFPSIVCIDRASRQQILAHLALQNAKSEDLSVPHLLT